MTEPNAGGANASARMIDLPSRGGAMATLEWGPTNRPIDVIWSHANGFNGLTYRSILAPLGDTLRVMAVDLRGHGASRLPADVEGRTDWYDMRDDVLALLEALDGPAAVLAGHSMGGAASLMAAAQAPGRVRGLVLFDPVVLPPEASAAARAGGTGDNPLRAGALRRRAIFPDKAAARAAYAGRGAFRTWSEAMIADYVEAGFRDRADGQVELTCAPEWEASSFASQAHESAAAFAASRAPVDVLRAAEGSTCRFEPDPDGGRIRVETAPGTTHFLPMERRELVRERLAALAAD